MQIGVYPPDEAASAGELKSEENIVAKNEELNALNEELNALPWEPPLSAMGNHIAAKVKQVLKADFEEIAANLSQIDERLGALEFNGVNTQKSLDQIELAVKNFAKSRTNL